MSVPQFVHTPVEDITTIHDRLYKTFHAQKTRTLEWRLTQLRKLWWALKDNEDAIVEACRRDLGKSHFETYLTEVGWCLNDIVFVCNNLKKWMKEEAALDIDLMHWAVKPKIRKDPLGVVLVLGAYNFPFNLSMGPFIGAIAAGCTAVLKPSENSPNAAAVMQKIVAEALDSDAYTVVQGAIPESTALLDCKWDKIFYTGGGVVGKIISKKAAETLTPIILELGGRNPAIVTANANPRIAARRLLWAKFHNAGQVCVSQNYILVERSLLKPLVDEIKIAIDQFFPQGSQESEDYSKIVNERQWNRMKAMIDNSKGKILLGGKMDPSTKFLEPTVVLVEDADDSMVTEESFGPLIPIMAFDNLDDAIRTANKIDPTPLGLYPFGSKQEVAKILDATRSGGVSVNDGFYHCSVPTLEFGGVGDSGQGSYRGKQSFDAFTHRRAVTTTPNWMEKLLDIRYPPYTGKLSTLKFLTDKAPNFDRNGKSTVSTLRWILSLGADGTFQGLLRWSALLVALFAAQKQLRKQHLL